MSQSEVKSDQLAKKFCHIIKRSDFDGYGFNLHSEKAKPGQFIGKVDSNSPAESAGLKEGDRIIEVNDVAIGNESHKQVVQRIKAIANEVRLLLIDVDGKGDKQTINGNAEEMVGTSQTMPGVSENINTITMVSTKRVSQESQHSTATVSANGSDQIDNANVLLSNTNNNNNNNNNTINTMKSTMTNIPPPPSATMAATNKIPANGSPKETNNASSSISTTTTSSSSSSVNANGTGSIKAGSLQLPMTAAEMRAKLASKKKYDPKNESVDLRKKYEIVQKL